jgi:hypothetical protein
MSAVATRGAPVRSPLGEGTEAHTPRLFDPPGPSLEDALVASWDELTITGHTTCPVCSGEMSRTGVCESCGSELA